MVCYTCAQLPLRSDTKTKQQTEYEQLLPTLREGLCETPDEGHEASDEYDASPAPKQAVQPVVEAQMRHQTKYNMMFSGKARTHRHMMALTA